MPELNLTSRDELVRGRGQFVADLRLSDALEVAFVRSPVAFAKITHVDVPEGCGLSGADLCPSLDALRVEGHHIRSTDWFPLASEVVRYIGEPIAMVWADSRYAAEDLADLVDVGYESMPDGTPIHNEIPDGVYFEMEASNGDVDAAFAEAAHVFERTFSNSRVSAVPIEGRGVVASWDGERITMWTSTQIPNIVQLAVAHALRLDEDHVRVLVPDVGGGFGQKAHVFPEEIAIAAAARHLGRTLRWVEDRNEAFLAGGHAHDTRVQLRVATRADGTLLAVDHNTIHDAGGHPNYPHSPLSETVTCAYNMFGPYRVDASRISARAIASNRCPAGVHRGVGGLAAVHATERMMDEIAAELDIDPLEIRRRNVLPHDPNIVGAPDYQALLNQLAAACDYDSLREMQLAARREGRIVGVGVTVFNEGSGVSATDYRNRALTSISGYDASRVLVKGDGRLEIRTSAAEAGQGHAATYREIARRITGIPPTMIDVLEGDTDLCPTGTGTFASRGAVGVFESLVQALEEGCRAGMRPGTDITKTLDQPHELAQCAAMAVVEIDPLSLIPSVERFLFVHDCGTVVMEDLVAAQIQGGAANGIGCVLLEAHSYTDADQILTSTMVDYLIPLATDVPNVEIHHRESRSPMNTLGSKGCGEVGTIAAHGAVATAVADALRGNRSGALLTHLPYTPQSIFDALHEEVIRGA